MLALDIGLQEILTFACYTLEQPSKFMCTKVRQEIKREEAICSMLPSK